MPDWSYQSIFRPILFRMEAQKARNVTLRAMGTLASLPLGPRLIAFMGRMKPPRHIWQKVGGMRVPAPVGLDAGLDPDQAALRAFSEFGFGYLEVGPVTERAIPWPAPVRRLEAESAIWYPDEPANAGMDALTARLRRSGPLKQPVGIRLAHAPGVDGYEAAAERCRLIAKLAEQADFFTLDTRIHALRYWTRPEWSNHLRAVLQAAQIAGAPLFLMLPPDASRSHAFSLVRMAMEVGLDGIIIAGGVERDGGRVEGPMCKAPALEFVQYLREYGVEQPIFVSGGVHQPIDALDLLSAGATCVQVHSGLVYAGPGLPKRINEAAAHASAQGRTPFRPVKNWIAAWLMGLAVLLAGLTAIGIALTSVVLPYDEHFVGFTRAHLNAINPHLLSFLAHDRISYAGAATANGLLWMFMAHYGLRRGQHWARQAFLISGLVGFATFFVFLGYGYFDPLHALFSLALVPLFLLGVRQHYSELPGSPPDLYNDWRWKVGQWGQLLFVGLGMGIMISGLTMSGLGITSVFVPQDLTFMQTSAGVLHAASDRLIPMIAHDRAGFGGALVTNGLQILLVALWGYRPGARWVWWAMLTAGAPSYALALWTHVEVGYTDFMHLLPVYIGLSVFMMALLLSYPCLCPPVRHPGRRIREDAS